MSDTFYSSQSILPVTVNTTYTGGMPGALTLKYAVMGRVISLTWTGIVGIPGSPSYNTTSYVLPSDLWPNNLVNFAYRAVNNGARSTGMFEITQLGELFWYADDGGGNFTGPSGCQIFASGVTYPLQ